MKNDVPKCFCYKNCCESQLEKRGIKANNYLFPVLFYLNRGLLLLIIDRISHSVLESTFLLTYEQT